MNIDVVAEGVENFVQAEFHTKQAVKLPRVIFIQSLYQLKSLNSIHLVIITNNTKKRTYILCGYTLEYVSFCTIIVTIYKDFHKIMYK